MEQITVSAVQYQEMFDIAERGDGDYHFIKGNLPDSWEKYGSGNGEGIWIVVDSETKRAHDADKGEGTFFAFLANHSIYHPELNVKALNAQEMTATSIPFEFRGSSRPVLAKKVLEELL